MENRWDSLGSYYEGDLESLRLFSVGDIAKIVLAEPTPEDIASPLGSEFPPYELPFSSPEAPNGWGA